MCMRYQDAVVAPVRVRSRCVHIGHYRRFPARRQVFVVVVGGARESHRSRLRLELIVRAHVDVEPNTFGSAGFRFCDGKQYFSSSHSLNIN